MVSLYCPAGAGPIGLILTQEAWGLLVILPPLPDQPRQEVRGRWRERERGGGEGEMSGPDCPLLCGLRSWWR